MKDKKMVITTNPRKRGGYGFISDAGLWVDIEIVPKSDPRPDIFESLTKDAKNKKSKEKGK